MAGPRTERELKRMSRELHGHLRDRDRARRKRRLAGAKPRPASARSKPRPPEVADDDLDQIDD